MSLPIRPAQRSNAKPLIGFYSKSGGGKTYTSLVVARGFVGAQGNICMIESEGGRGESYADKGEYPEIGGYNVISLRDDFAPKRFHDALMTAQEAKTDALIIDGGSMEWEGAGGVLAMAARNQQEGKKNMLVWQVPKLEHQRYFLLPLIATAIPLVILNMRAKYPMVERKKDDGKKEWLRSEELEPIQSDDILYEVHTHGWFDQEHRFHLTQCRSKSMRPIFEKVVPLTNETGRHLAAWAKGAAAAPVESPSPPLSDSSVPVDGAAAPVASNGDDVNAWAIDFGSKMTLAIHGSKSVQRIDAFLAKNATGLTEYKAWSEEKWNQLMELAAVRKVEILNAQ